MMTDYLSVATEIAREVGALQKERRATFSRDDVEYKRRRDLVTDVDRECERLVVERILARFPNHGILGEEETNRAGTEPVRWIVDPIDGTTNFVHGYPHYNVSIGVEVKGERVAGVVYDSAMDELFSAEKGAGAEVNGKSIRVSSCSDLEKSLLSTGFASLRGSGDETNLKRFCRAMQKAEGMRRIGAAAVDLCYVAAGRLDGYWEDFLNPWDMAAGTLIVEEAGGRVADHDGGPDFFTKGSIIAAPPELFDELFRFVLKSDA